MESAEPVEIRIRVVSRACGYFGEPEFQEVLACRHNKAIRLGLNQVNPLLKPVAQ
jgi:hypothetical protein